MSVFHLYRHYDDTGSLLYVGQSSNAFSRQKGHQYRSEWFDLSVTMRVERFESKEAVTEAELDAIKQEKPLFNRCNVAKGKRRHGLRHTGRPMQLYATEEFIAALDEWRREQPDLPNRSEAIRRIVEQVLPRKPRPR
jgi:hypothetical protein